MLPRTPPRRASTAATASSPSWSSTSTPAYDASSRATRSSPPVTGSPTTSWPDSAELDLDRATLGPVVDTSLRTSVAGVYAIGNLVHPVDTADGAALDGRHVVAGVRAHLAGRAPDPTGLRITAAAPFRWVTPQRVRDRRDRPARRPAPVVRPLPAPPRRPGRAGRSAPRPATDPVACRPRPGLPRPGRPGRLGRRGRRTRRARARAGSRLVENCVHVGGVRRRPRWYGRSCNRCRFQQV